MKERITLYIRSALALVHLLAAKLCSPSGFHSGWAQDFSLTTRILVRGGRITLGKRIHTKRGVLLRADGGILSVGDGCYFGSGCAAVSRERISIGKNTSFGPNVMIYDHDHDIHSGRSVHDSGFITSPIIIGSDVWIGANSVILRGSALGDGCVVGAGSVIKGNYPPFSVIVQKRGEVVTNLTEREARTVE